MTPRVPELLKVDLEQLVENAPAAVFVKDPSGKYLYVNRQWELVTGVASAEALERTDFDLFSQEVAAIYRSDDLQALRGSSPIRFEEPVLVEGSERLFSTVKFCVLDQEEVVGVCGISVDITAYQPDDPEAVTQSRADAFFGRLLASLTPQEVRVLDLVVAGLSDREIAERLNLTGGTVRHHVSHLLKKLRKRRGQVIIQMLKRGSV